MMRIDTFGRSLGFAAAAAVAAPAVWHLTGHPASLHLTWVVLSAAYAFGLARQRGAERRARGLFAASAVGGVGVFAALAGFGSAGVAVATTAALGCLRASWLHPGRGARGWWVEAALGVGALALAGFMLRSVSGDPTAVVAAIWGYWLVQSLYFLAPGSFRERAPTGRDGFEEARRRLLALLDEGA
jgi:hypothetical protein